MANRILVTPAQRDHVVTVLRCAAWLMITGDSDWQSTAIYSACNSIDDTMAAGHLAVRAVDALPADAPRPRRRRILDREWLFLGLLEAAARVEEAVYAHGCSAAHDPGLACKHGAACFDCLPKRCFRNAAPWYRFDNEGAACRVCGCTDDDCSECIERTGAPCSWAEAGLCSACVGRGS